MPATGLRLIKYERHYEEGGNTLLMAYKKLCLNQAVGAVWEETTYGIPSLYDISVNPVLEIYPGCRFCAKPEHGFGWGRQLQLPSHRNIGRSM